MKKKGSYLVLIILAVFTTWYIEDVDDYHYSDKCYCFGSECDSMEMNFSIDFIEKTEF